MRPIPVDVVKVFRYSFFCLSATINIPISSIPMATFSKNESVNIPTTTAPAQAP